MKHAFTTLSISLLLTLGAPGSALPEPDTVIYGKILNRHGPSEHLLTSGQLQWTIRRVDGTELDLATSLEPLADGRFSYRLNIPHHALSLGLEAALEELGLTINTAIHTHAAMAVDGHPAIILSPATTEFEVAQALRGGTLRIDLALDFPEPDSDGDGMPDWWEDENGLDSQSNDGDGDADGDGLNNLGEYLADSDPNADNRIPQLATDSIVAYQGRVSGVLLDVIDADTIPAQITFTLLEPPATGQLTRDGALLRPGEAFTLQQVQDGSITYADSDGELDGPVPVGLSLTDGTPDHTTEVQVEIRPYAPLSDPAEGLTAEAVAVMVHGTGLLPGVLPEEDLQTRGWLLGGIESVTVWDLQASARNLTLASDGSETPRFILGGSGDETLSGQNGDDWLSGGRGDDTLAGRDGADRFVIVSIDDGNDTLDDFDPAEGDVLDLSRLLDGSSPSLSDYLRLSTESGVSTLAVDANGDGSGFDDLEISLGQLPGEWADLHALWAAGHILSPGLGLPPRVSIAATVAEASENEPSLPGIFTISRSGDVGDPLVVPLSLGGAAINGLDYSFIGSSITIPAGMASATLAILPFQDSLSEPTEVVELRVLAGAGYDLRSPVSAQVSIRDLMPSLTIETIEPLALQDTGQPAVFPLTRSGLIQQSVFVRLAIAGSARAGSDYLAVPAYANFTSGQTTQLIEIRPDPGADLSGGAESVVISILDNSAYLTAEPGSARAMIAEKTLNFAAWRDMHFPGGGNPESDPGNTGTSLLERYAFGLNPLHPGAGEARHGSPRPVWRDGRFGISFHREYAATDLDYVVELGPDLHSWYRDSQYLEEVLPSPADPDSGRVVVLVDPSLADRPDVFMRVRLVHRP